MCCILLFSVQPRVPAFLRLCDRGLDVKISFLDNSRLSSSGICPNNVADAIAEVPHSMLTPFPSQQHAEIPNPLP